MSWCGANSASALPGEKVPQSVVVVFIKGCIYERVKKGIRVTQPQKDALPNWRDVTGAQRHYELRDEEGDPAKHEHADQNSNHKGRLLLLLLAPCVPICLEGHGCMAHCEHHLGLVDFILYLGEAVNHRIKKLLNRLHSSICQYFSASTNRNL